MRSWRLTKERKNLIGKQNNSVKADMRSKDFVAAFFYCNNFWSQRPEVGSRSGKGILKGKQLHAGRAD